MFEPKLDILPDAQRRLWPELAQTPPAFVLYGGTAIALRLGHRASVDFDFFSPQPFIPDALTESVPYLDGALVRQSAANTLVVTVDRQGPVQVAFFGGLKLRRVDAAEPVAGPGIGVASLLDLAGTKVKVVTQRAEAKDFLDIHALLTQAGIPLQRMLAAARAIYGPAFNPLVSLKAIGWFGEPALAVLPAAVRRDLTRAVAAIDPDRLPTIKALPPQGEPG